MASGLLAGRVEPQWSVPTPTISTEVRWLPSDTGYEAAIMRTVDHVEAMGGGTVFVPPDDNCRILKRTFGLVCVELPGGVWLRGGGPTRTCLRYDDLAQSSHMISVAEGGARGHAVTDMLLDHGRMGSSGDSGQSGHIIRNLDGSDFRFERLVLQNARGYCIGNFVERPLAVRHIGVFRDLLLKNLGADGIDFKVADDVANRYTGIEIDNVRIEGFGTGVGIDLRCHARVQGVEARFTGDGRHRAAAVRTRGSGFGSTISTVRVLGPGRQHQGCSAIVAMGRGTRITNIRGSDLDRVVLFPDQGEDSVAQGRVPAAGACVVRDIQGYGCTTVALIESDDNVIDGLVANACDKAFEIGPTASGTRVSRWSTSGMSGPAHRVHRGAIDTRIDDQIVSSGNSDSSLSSADSPS